MWGSNNVKNAGPAKKLNIVVNSVGPTSGQENFSVNDSVSTISRSFHNPDPKNDTYRDLFKRLCSAITIHGVYYWDESKTWWGKLIWFGIVVVGIIGAAIVIYDSYKIWGEHPVLTTVKQIPVETGNFPSITICPMDGTEFGFVENYINVYGSMDEGLELPLRNVFLDILRLLRKAAEPHIHFNDCLYTLCDNDVRNATVEKCPRIMEFENYLAKIPNAIPYEEFVLDEMLAMADFIFQGFEFNESLVEPLSQTDLDKTPTCQDLIEDYGYFLHVSKKFDHPLNQTEFRPGSLLRFLFVQLEDHALQMTMFRKYLTGFPMAWSRDFGHDSFENHPLPDLIQILEYANVSRDDDLAGLEFNLDLFRAFIQSHHPPHVFDYFKNTNQGTKPLLINAQSCLNVGLQGDGLQTVASPTFPFCWYHNENISNSGVPFGPYGERYCDGFQATISEHGLCYTYNNEDLHTNGIHADRGGDIANLGGQGGKAFEVHRIQGCGKKKGLRLVLDSNEMFSRGRITRGSKGYLVYITNPGVVTQKINFHIHPAHVGEYLFHIHSTNLIKASKEFKAWNQNLDEDKVCFFGNDANLTYFENKFSQANCLMECKLKRITDGCNCAPWYLNQEEYPVCNSRGNACIRQAIDDYHYELEDVVGCNCKDDCEIHNFFTSLTFQQREFTDMADYYDENTQTGGLANYLLDPEHFFTDFTVSNLTRLLYNLTDQELAKRRFQEDITILNFYFDTPLIFKNTLEMRMTIFSQISAIGGALGLFTGISLISMVETVYWAARFLLTSLSIRARGLSEGRGTPFTRGLGKNHSSVYPLNDIIEKPVVTVESSKKGEFLN